MANEKPVVKVKVKSAAKQARSSQRKNIRNQFIQNRIRSGLRRFSELAKSDPKNAVQQGRQVVSWLDRAAKSGVLHVNASRRHKAKVMAQLQTIKVA